MEGWSRGQLRAPQTPTVGKFVPYGSHPTREWVSFLHGQDPLRQQIIYHIHRASQDSNTPSVRPTSFSCELSIACDTTEERADLKTATASALALLILFSIKSKNCAWLRDRTLCDDPPKYVERALRRIRRISAVTEKKDSNFFLMPLRYNNSDVEERETAIAIRGMCNTMVTPFLKNLFVIVTG